MFGSRKALLAALASVMVGVAPATAQLYFRPFFRPFAYTFDYPAEPDEDPGPARFASRRAVASILAREGFRLVGPLGRRGAQVVATGHSRHDGDIRFIIDPYEGRIIRGIRLAPPEHDMGPRRDDGMEYVRPLGGSSPVVREFDRDDDAPRGRRRERSARLREAPEREGIVMDAQRERAAAPRRIAPQTPPPAAPLATPTEVKATEPKAPEPKATAPKATRDAQPVAVAPARDAPIVRLEKPAPRVVYPGPDQSAAGVKPAPDTSIIAKSPPGARTPAIAGVSTPKTAANPGTTSHRAIVAPTDAASSGSTRKAQ